MMLATATIIRNQEGEKNKCHLRFTDVGPHHSHTSQAGITALIRCYIQHFVRKNKISTTEIGKKKKKKIG